MLQIEQVFSNVTKGQVAKKDDWSKAFKNEDMDKVIEEVNTYLVTLIPDPAQGRAPGEQSGTGTPTSCAVS